MPPHLDAPRRWQIDAEILTYVREGTLVFEDSLGHTGILHAGEFQRMATGTGTSYRETNASRTGWAHVFQMWLRSSGGPPEPGHEQKYFGAATRRGRLCLIASPDGRDGSLRVHLDALVFSALLEPGQHVSYALLPERCAWLHVVLGEVALDDVDLATGDGASIDGERGVSLIARGPAEILMLDLGRGVIG